MAPLEGATVSELIDRLRRYPAQQLETQSLEIKSWCKNAKDLSHEIAEAAVCLSNASGGMIVVGVDDKKIAPASVASCPYSFLTPDVVKKWIRDLTRPPVECAVTTVGALVPTVAGTDLANIYVIGVQRTNYVSGHRTSQGVSYVRVDTECRPQYFVEQDDYSALPLEHLTIDDLSQASLKAAIGHREARRLGSAPADLLPVDYLVGAGLARHADDSPGGTLSGLVPTVAGLIFLGNEEPLKEAFPASETVFIVEALPLAPLTSSNWYNFQRALASYVPSINRHLSTRDAAVPDNVLVELLLNAYLHRCYRTPGPVQILIRDDELEIRNPGGLLGSLTPETVIYDTPQYRNFLLADAARQFGYCEKAGSGIDKIYYQLILDGFDLPIFESDANSFRVTIRLKRDRAFAQFIRDFSGGLNLKLTDLIATKAVQTGRATQMREIAQLAQRSEDYMHEVLAGLERRSLITRTDGRYALSVEASNQIARYDDSGQLKLF
jgi:ATP-dependent DNA helicase RecG